MAALAPGQVLPPPLRVHQSTVGRQVLVPCYTLSGKHDCGRRGVPPYISVVADIVVRVC